VFSSSLVGGGHTFIQGFNRKGRRANAIARQ
jgi:hypothetical protein